MNAESDNISITPLEMADGDPGYFSHGHVDRAAFVAMVNEEFEEHFKPEDAEHVFQTELQPARMVGKFDKPSQYEGDHYWWLCNADDPGAFACTFVRAG